MNTPAEDAVVPFVTATMNIHYVPLLQIQRELHAMPRGMPRFRTYLRTLGGKTDGKLEFPPLVIMNPMGREHVTALLDQLLALNADAIGARAAAEASERLADVAGQFRAALVIADDLRGGWTNRYATEHSLRFPDRSNSPKMPRWAEHVWITGVLWSSEPATEPAAREAILTAAYRVVYMHKHGIACTLREKMAQEGTVMAWAGCAGPVLEAEDLDYTREVIAPYFEAEDIRTAIECLFGDAPGATLGFTPRGLSPWAGLALALHDAIHAWSSSLATSDLITSRNNTVA